MRSHRRTGHFGTLGHEVSQEEEEEEEEEKEKE